MRDQSFAIGLSLAEIDLLLDAISMDNTPLAKLVRHRLWEVRVKLLRRMMPALTTAPESDMAAQLRVVTD